MLTSYRCHLLTIAVIFLLFIYFQLDPLPYLFIAGIVFLVLAYLVPARSAKSSYWTLGLNHGPNSTVAKPPDHREPQPRSSASTTSYHLQNRNLKHVLPSENVTHNYVGISTPWGRTASSAVLQRRVLASRTMGSSEYHGDAKSYINRGQPYQTASASSLYRQSTTSSLRPTSGLANQVLTAAYPQVQQPRYGRLGSFPTVNLHPQPLPFLKERNTNMMHSPVTIKIGPPTKLYPSRADYLYGSNITRPPDMDVVIPALGTRKRTCMSPNADEVNEQAKRQCREDNASNRSEFISLHPVPSVLNGMLRSTANILMQQSASAGSQKRRFDGSTENLSLKRNRNNEISSSYSSSRRLATKRKKRKLSRSSSPSLKAHKSEPNKSSEENLEEAAKSQLPIPSLPLSKPVAGSSSAASSAESSGFLNTTSENSNLSVSEKSSPVPLTPWSEGFSRKRQLSVYASVTGSAISKPLYVPEGSVSVEDDHRDLQASQARLQKIMAGVSKAFQAKDEKMKSQRTPGQVAFMPTIQSPDVPSPLSLGATGFTTSTPVTSLQVLPSLPAESSLTSTPTLKLAATSSAGLLSIATPTTAVTTAVSTSLTITGSTVTCMTTPATSSTSLVSPSLNFGFTAVTTQSPMPIVSSAHTSNESATSLVQSASTLASVTAVTGTTSIVPSFSNTFLTNNTAPIPTSSDPLPLGGLLPSSTNNLTSIGTALSLPFPSSSVVSTAESTQKQSSFQMTTPTNLIGFGSTNFSNSAEVLGNPPPYAATISASAISGSNATASAFPSFAFSAGSSISLPTSQLPTVAVTTTTVSAPQFSLTTTLATTAGSPFVLNSPLTSNQKPQQELGRLTEVSSSNPFAGSNFGGLPSTRANTSTFSFQNPASTVATGLPSLSFGSVSSNMASINNTSVASTLVSPFGSAPAANTFNKTGNSATTPFFQLNSSVSQTAPAQPKPLLQFGGSSVANGSSSQFQFGQNNASHVPSSNFLTTTSQSAPAFSFGLTTSAAQPSLQFGQTTSSEVSAPIKPATAASLFQFGPTSAPSGLASAAPSFNFGSTNAGFAGSNSNPVGSSSTGGFTFSLLSAAGPSPSTFQTSNAGSNFFAPQNTGLESTAFGTASSSGFNFGSGTTDNNLLSNGSNQAQPNAGNIFQFGTGAATQPALTNASAGFNFGAQSQQISTGGFNFNVGATQDLNFGATRNTVSSSGSGSSTRRAAQARRRINR